uniref:Tyrosine recombinase n=1 Tax=Melicertus latisulcatus pemonivirus TaxID=2984278 RepID=A0A9C7BMU9_9VIRU|nr:MAG: tyrosine recombinase [Melicertus latisulcatus pemonivirus]
MICAICGKQPIKLKRHIQNTHKLEGKELERLYNQAKYEFKGLSYRECSICGKGVRYLRLHLTRMHKLDPSTPEYKEAVGTQSEYARSVNRERLEKIRTRRRHINANVPVSVFEWIRYEARAGTSVDSKGMRRNVRLVLDILRHNSLNFMDLVTPNLIDRTYKIVYDELVKKYKHLSISVILGHVKRFVDWACSEADFIISPRVRREHEMYTKLCRRRGGRENLDRKMEEYIPTLRDVAPLIQAVKHRHIIDGLLKNPSKTIENDSIDLIHATIALPCILKCGVRTGVLMNMRVDEVLGATRYQEGFIIKVKNHKTSEHYGPYQIGLTEEEYNLILNFIRNRTWTSEYTFSTKGGKKFSLSNIQRFMRVLFNMYGLKDLRITTFRKFLTSYIHKDGNDNMIEATASLLKHSVKTARKDYKAMQHDRDALRTANSLSHMLKRQLEQLGQGLLDNGGYHNKEGNIRNDMSGGIVNDTEIIEHVENDGHVIQAQEIDDVIRPDGHLEDIEDDDMERLILEDCEESKEQQDQNEHRQQQQQQNHQQQEKSTKMEPMKINEMLLVGENDIDKENETANTSRIQSGLQYKTKIFVRSPNSFVSHVSKDLKDPLTEKTIIVKKVCGPRRFFLPRHLDKIKNIFNCHIQAGMKPTIREIRDKDNELREIYEHGYETENIENKIAESVRSQIRLNLKKK